MIGQHVPPWGYAEASRFSVQYICQHCQEGLSHFGIPFFIFPILFDRYDGNTLLNTVEVYDPLRDTWDVLDDSMATPRCDAGVCVVRMP